MKKRFVSKGIVLLFLLGLISVFRMPSAHALLLDYHEVQITTDLNTQFDSRIDGNYIVYTDERSGNYDVYLYNIETGVESPITNSEEHEFLNDVSGNIVVYTQARFDDDDIFVYDISTGQTKQITDPDDQEFAFRRSPGISGTYVVWQDNRGPGGYDIYGYDLSTETESLLSRERGDQLHPVIHGNLVVWEDHRNADNPDIYVYDMSTPEIGAVRIPADERLALPEGVVALQSFPDVYGRYVVFAEVRSDDINNQDIVLWDLDTNQAIWTTVDPTDQSRPRIDGTRIVWQDERNGNLDIYTYDITTGEVDPVTTDPSTQFLCDVSGDRIVWTDLRNVSGEHPGNYDIYMLEPLVAPKIHVSPTSLNFGDVEIGQSSLLIATISNLGNSPLEITVEYWEMGQQWFAFAFTPTTATVDPGAHIDFTVTFAPSFVGVALLSVKIYSNDPDRPSVEVSMWGYGVEAVVPPEQMFQDLLDFYDANIESGNLQGIGPNDRSAENRETVIHNMIASVSDAYADGLICGEDGACDILQSIYEKIDGEPNPPDFIDGDPTVLEELRQKVLDLMFAIGCGTCT